MEEEKFSNPLNEIMKFIEKLELEKTKSLQDENYFYTEELKYKIEEMKKKLSEERRKQLLIQHDIEVDSLNSSYKQELNEFNSIWDEKLKNLEEKSKKLEENLNLKHTQQMNELYDFLEQKLPKKVKFSKAYFETKCQQEKLLKIQKYADAAHMKKKLEDIENSDIIKFNNEKYEKIKAESVKTANKHLTEKSALKQRIELEFEILNKERKENLEKLLLKYKIRKVELESQQIQEKTYVENDNLLKRSNFFT